MGPVNRDLDCQSWGANLVELEPLRYRHRRELTRALRNYDLIHVVAGGPALAAAVTAAGPPVVLHVATTLRWEREARSKGALGPARLWRSAMTRWLARIEKRALLNSNLVLVLNDHMLNFVRELGQQNAVKAPPGVDVRRFRPSDSGWNPGGPLLSVCRFAEPRKRLDRLVTAYRDLVRSVATCPDLILAGRGTVPASVHRLIADAGLSSRIVLRSDVSPQELPLLYRNASLYVQTSQEEGLGLSVLEAMASGLPVVASDTAGARECVVDGVSGWLVPQQPETAISSRFSTQIHDVLTGSGRAMALAARERCEATFSTEATLRQTTDLYDGLLDRLDSRPVGCIDASAFGATPA